MLKNLPNKYHVPFRQIVIDDVHNTKFYVAVRIFFPIADDQCLNNIAGNISTTTRPNPRANGKIPFTRVGGLIFYDALEIERVLQNQMRSA